MGDRVLFQVFKLDPPTLYGEFSPVIYAHWAGSDASKICEAIKIRMQGRAGDVEYTSARLIQIIGNGNNEGNTGIGIWNTDKLLTEEDSHGDAGVILIKVSDIHEMQFICLGGYLNIDNQTGYPRKV